MISPKAASLIASSRASLGALGDRLRDALPARPEEPPRADQAKFVLASGSPRRLALLQQVGIEPDGLRPTSIDETPKKGEVPRALVRRLARAKAEAAWRQILSEEKGIRGAFILGADTAVAVGRRIVTKAETHDRAAAALQLLSGRSHRVYTGVCLVLPTGQMRQRVVETRVRFKRLSRLEIDAYLAGGEWQDKAGAYAIQGTAGAFVAKLVGSYTNVVGLPLTEVVNMLQGAGYPVYARWLTSTVGTTE